jgi:hypothetical protein
MRIVCPRRMDGGSLALLWLMRRKRPGKICRKGPILPLSVTAAFPEMEILLNKFNRLPSRRGVAQGSHRGWRIAGHGSGEVIRQVI